MKNKARKKCRMGWVQLSELWTHFRSRIGCWTCCSATFLLERRILLWGRWRLSEDHQAAHVFKIGLHCQWHPITISWIYLYLVESCHIRIPSTWTLDYNGTNHASGWYGSWENSPELCGEEILGRHLAWIHTKSCAPTCFEVTTFLYLNATFQGLILYCHLDYLHNITNLHS